MNRFNDPIMEEAVALITWTEGSLNFVCDFMQWAAEWCEDNGYEKPFFYKDFQTIYAKPKPETYDSNENEHSDGRPMGMGPGSNKGTT